MIISVNPKHISTTSAPTTRGEQIVDGVQLRAGDFCTIITGSTSVQYVVDIDDWIVFSTISPTSIAGSLLARVANIGATIPPVSEPAPPSAANTLLDLNSAATAAAVAAYNAQYSLYLQYRQQVQTQQRIDLETIQTVVLFNQAEIARTMMSYGTGSGIHWVRPAEWQGGAVTMTSSVVDPNGTAASSIHLENVVWPK